MTTVFNIDLSFTHLAVRREQVLTLLVSINGVAVKVPGIPTSPAMAYIAAWDVGGGRASAVIYLYYNAINRAVGYSPESRQFLMTDLPQMLDEAREFLESMGFMLDDSAFRTLKPEQQHAIIERIPLFHQDLSRFAAARDAQEIPDADLIEVAPAAASASQPATVTPTSTERAQKVGRLLSSF